MSPLVKGASKALAASPPSIPVDDRERARGIATIQAAMRERGARARRRRIAVGVGGFTALAAAAAAVVIVRGQTTPSTLTARAPTLAVDTVTMTATATDGEVTLSDGDGTEAARPLAPNALVRVGSRIVASHGAHAMLGFSTGTSLGLDGSDVVVLDASSTERFDLRDGAIAAKVSHLAPGRRFVVQTPDAEVEVRGTTFRVTVLPPGDACIDGTRTSVVVTEGVVVVRRPGDPREERVEAGASWPPACHVMQAAGGAAGALPRPNGTAAAISASTLSAQNDLFADAMTAKRSGDKRRAVDTLDELIAKYPRGPLVESAEAERFRLLRDVDPARASAEASAYLRRYPKGFARDEAQAILSP